MSDKIESNREQAWKEWWLAWPSSFARDEFKMAFCAGYTQGATATANNHQALVEALKAVLVAVDCNASQGGDLGVRLNKSNPLTVEAVRAALAAVEEK